jgi:hypothetical protein
LILPGYLQDIKKKESNLFWGKNGPRGFMYACYWKAVEGTQNSIHSMTDLRILMNRSGGCIGEPQ